MVLRPTPDTAGPDVLDLGALTRRGEGVREADNVAKRGLPLFNNRGKPPPKGIVLSRPTGSSRPSSSDVHRRTSKGSP
ncbi:hypothetical protein Sya03_56610 [Spirilliplanes yamanashiensis]|uniref:Uncharacterized protein n=1 Tax=Spirilliplanes yamanashiensis TaxID=42233 RepID=A0A8J3YE97_9ACTN|nr:hypothetical protein Sya03_56610 [Spirilliplanes yamanashiensis]